MLYIKISSDFSDTPGSRFKEDGEFSGELFRDTILIEKYEQAEKTNSVLEIDFDDCYGIGTSFLEETFGGLVRKYHKRNILQRLKIISTEDETIPDNIKRFIEIAKTNDR